jgi:hypothetical protein
MLLLININRYQKGFALKCDQNVRQVNRVENVLISYTNLSLCLIH